MMAQWDDHESANDSWEGGAENHHADQGDWNARRAAAMQVYREWMPVSDSMAAYDIGGLATFFRTKPACWSAPAARHRAAVQGGRSGGGAQAFRDGAWMDPAATMMGSAQEAWLADGMRRSARSGRAWQIAYSGRSWAIR
jgi:alkaline phosphatase D